MDLTGLISGLQQSQVLGTVQTRVARMILDDEQSQGAAAVQMIEAAVAGGNNGDSSAAGATGLGGQVDRQA